MKKGISKSIYQEIVEILAIFTNAVRKVQAENRKLGLPNVYCKGDTLFYQLPDGRITTSVPEKLFRNSSMATSSSGYGDKF